jgi:hypothetical protein
MILEIVSMKARVNAAMSSLSVIKDKGFWFMEYVDTVIEPVAGVNIGYLIFFPLISLVFEIDINKSISIFFNFFYIFGFIWSLIFFLKIKKISIIQKSITTLILFYSFFFVSNKLFDIAGEYLFYFLSPIMLIPYFLFLKNNEESISKFFLYSTFLIITIFGVIFSLIKDHSMLGSILFGCIILFKCSRLRNLFIVSLFLVFITSKLLINFVESKQIQNYIQLYGEKPKIDYLINSSLYHSFYIGLAFTDNGYVEKFRDDNVAKMLKEKNKNYQRFHTKTNHEIAKKEIIRIIREDPQFFARNIFAKIGVIFMWFLVYCNIGLLYFFLNNVKGIEKISYLTIIFFYSIFPIITIPTSFYMMGIYGIATSILILFIQYVEKDRLIKLIKSFIKEIKS